MTHPLAAYFSESKDGHITDDAAKEDITGLINDQELIKEVCTAFRNANNSDSSCYTVGKVYDVHGESQGCVTVLSDDVVNIIGEESLQDIQEQMNYILITTYLEFKRICKGADEVFDAWDGYLDLVMSKNFLSLYENGVRARLIHNGRIDQTLLPIVVFTIFLDYGAVYG